MTVHNRWTGAAHLEEIAAAMTEIDTRPDEGRFLGVEEIVAEAVEHLLTAMFPYHMGKARGRFVETEKRTWELMRAYDALTQALSFVCDCADGAAYKALVIAEQRGMTRVGMERVYALRSELRAEHPGKE